MNGAGRLSRVAAEYLRCGYYTNEDYNTIIIMEIILIVIGIILTIIGIIGAIVPVLPGPPFNYLALWLLYIARGGSVLSLRLLIIMGVLTAAVTAVDYILPLAGARVYGASKQGMWGAALGMVIGIFFLPPLGLIAGALVGAVIGEIIAGKKGGQAIRTGMATLAGNVIAIMFKLALSVVMAYYFFVNLV